MHIVSFSLRNNFFYCKCCKKYPEENFFFFGIMTADCFHSGYFFSGEEGELKMNK